MLNRGALIVRPRKPYLDWAAGLDDSGMVPNPDDEQTVYLIPSYDSDDEALALLQTNFEAFFDAELFGWHTDESAWPKNRTFAMFKEWFKFELHSIVEDMCDFSLYDEDGLQP